VLGGLFALSLLHFKEPEIVKYTISKSSSSSAVAFESPQSPNSIYGPLPLPDSLSVSNAVITDPNENTFVDVQSPVKTHYRDANQIYQTNIFTQESIEITGTAGPAIEKIFITFTPSFGEEDVYELKKFIPGEEKWKYSASVPLGNLGPGLNTYTIRGYFTFGEKSYYVQRIITLQSALDTSVPVESSEGLLSVEWLPEPQKLQVTEFFRKHGILSAMEQYVRTWGGMGINGFKDLLGIYQIGKVQTGMYSGNNIYLYTEDYCFPDGIHCGEYSKIAYIIERTDGSFVRLKTQSTSVPLFVRFFDENATLNLGVPDFITVPNSKHALFFVGYDGVRNTSNDKKAFVSDSGLITFTKNSCLALQGKDGLVRNYNFNFTIPDPDPKAPVVSTQTDPPFAITWSDGTHNKGHYTITTGGCGAVFDCADPVDTQTPDYLTSIGKISIAGYTDAGDEVYEITPNERELRNPIAYLERVLPDDKWKKLKLSSDPADVYADHPIIFIKDPFGRYLRFINRKYWVWC
jgi:hypothetical protein